MIAERSAEFSREISLTLVALGALMACGGKALELDTGPRAMTSVDANSATSVELGDAIGEFRADDERVYWSSFSYKVQGCVYEDCEHTTLSYGTTEYGALALGNNDVFWTSKVDTSSVSRCPKTGCDGEPTKVVQDNYLIPVPLTADGDYFYWPSAFDTYRCPATGCGDFPEVVARDEVGTDLRFAGQFVYWELLNYQQNKRQSPVEFRRVPKDGSEPPATILSIALGESADTRGRYSVDATNFYWIDEAFQIQRCALEACNTSPPNTLVSTGERKFELQVDAIGFYWLEGDGITNGVIKFCPLSGCASGPRALTGGSMNRAFALSSRFLYWIDHQKFPDGYSAGHVIHRMLKPTP